MDDKKDSLFDTILKGENPGKSGLTHFQMKSFVKDKTVKIYNPHQRLGLFGVKLGMIRVLKKRTKIMTRSVMIRLRDNIVVKKVRIDHPNTELYSVTVAGIKANKKEAPYVSEEIHKLCYDAGIELRKVAKSFIVGPRFALEPGTKLDSSYFHPNRLLHIVARSIDRGFQGGMKRWGFKGMPETHGATQTHRRVGAIGGFKNLLYPGFKMPGHSGSILRCRRGKIQKINTKHDVLYVNCSVAGWNGTSVYLRDFFPNEDLEIRTNNDAEYVNSELILPYEVPLSFEDTDILPPM